MFLRYCIHCKRYFSTSFPKLCQGRRKRQEIDVKNRLKPGPFINPPFLTFWNKCWDFPLPSKPRIASLDSLFSGNHSDSRFQKSSLSMVESMSQFISTVNLFTSRNKGSPILVRFIPSRENTRHGTTSKTMVASRKFLLSFLPA